ncbi:MCE family protein [Actinomycetospora sp. TBRC 11914]|uniref:MCE family protein n=1 Tax=Actinomycetospora sp. TBRC 11914 TaxID=2729387 RepID=UPI00145F4F17|nr:MCE family protein [Actinomycetospora sp. TBRC 11914]NMO91618.1 MCE family protein [Actinomycetospora sp. TBRC 11914]
MRRRWALLPLLLCLSILAGCNYDGINDFALPGTQGREDGSYPVRIQMANVADLVPNNPVRVNDINVGVIRKVELQGWNALVTVDLNPDVSLPANATAQVGQVSLLGAKYIEIDPPKTEPATGHLDAGATIPLTRTGMYPATEDVLATVSTLLNGGGFAQIKTITTELDKALDGRAPQYRELLDQANTLITGVDRQKGDIINALNGIDRLAARVRAQDAQLKGALDDIPPALAVLDQEHTQIIDALQSLGQFGTTFKDVVDKSSGNLATDVNNLVPALRGLADSGQSLTKSLDLLGTLVFPLSTISREFRGDYINFWLTLDLTLGTLDKNFLTGTPLAGTLGGIEKALAGDTGAATKLINPLVPAGSNLPGAASLSPDAVQGGQPAQQAPAAGGSAAPAAGGAQPAAPAPAAPAPAPASGSQSGGVLGGLLGGGQ